MTKLDDDNDRLLDARGKRESGGPVQAIGNSRRDPILARIVRLFWAALGLVAVWAGNKLANNISDLNTNVTTLIVQVNGIIVKQAQKDTHDEYQDQQISDLKGDVREIQGKAFRGVPGYEQAKESRRGH